MKRFILWHKQQDYDLFDYSVVLLMVGLMVFRLFI